MSPSDMAKQSQFDSRQYPGVDNWQDTNLQAGNIVYIWEADGQSGHFQGNAYAMTPETALSCDGDPNKLKDSLQTDLNSSYNFHRDHLQAYRINEETPAAFAHCEANTCHGSGGGEQYYIPNFDERMHDGRIEKANDLNLDFHKDTLPISAEQIANDQKNTLIQPLESTPTPSQGTTATMDGAYDGPTPNKTSELKPQVAAAQSHWDTKGSAVDSQTAGEPPPQPTTQSSSQHSPLEVAGELPKEATKSSESATIIAGTTPDQAESIDLSDRNIGNKAELGLVEDGGKKAGDSINSATGIT